MRFVRPAMPELTVKVRNITSRKKVIGKLVDRHTPWGNPFILNLDGGRDEVCDLFAQYAQWRLTVQPDWLELLRGQDLYCWCSPKRCHADTLLRLANA